MKPKGITKVERHVEKIVLGVFAAFLLLVLLMQVGLVGGSRTVKVGSRDLPLDRAMGAVAESAQQRKAAVESAAVAPGIPESLPSPLERFRQARDGADLGPTLASISALGPAGLGGAASVSSGATAAPVIAAGDKPFILVEVPAPERPVVDLYEATIDPLEVQKHGSALASLLPQAQPYDVRSVSLQTTFDAERLRSIITSAPSDGSAQALPPSLWQGRVELVDVQWEREERLPDGTWGQATVVPPLPGRASMRDLITKPDFQPGDFRTMIEREAVERLEIRRPAFFGTISGSSWVWPSLAAGRGAADVREKVDAKVRQLRGLREQIKRFEDRLAAPPRDQRRRQPGARPDAPPPPSTPPPGGGGGGGGGGGREDWSSDDSHSSAGASEQYEFIWPQIPTNWLAQRGGGGGGGIGGGGGGGDGDSGDDNSDAARQRREASERREIENVRKQLDKAKSDESKLVSELLELGFSDNGAPIERANAFAEPIASLSSSESSRVTIWGHDLTARPGSVYRYRARVSITNPYFGRLDNLPSGGEDLSKPPVLVSGHSEWSAPVEVSPNVVYFITSASVAGGALGTSAKASVELFEFYYGYWRKANAILAPGDLINAQVELPEMSTFNVTAAPPSGQDASKPREFEAQPLARMREVSAGAVFLDTAPGPTDPQRVSVVLRDAQGRLEVHEPNNELPLVRRLNESATIGKTAVVRAPGSVPVETPAEQTPGSNTGDSPGNEGMPGGETGTSRPVRPGR